MWILLVNMAPNYNTEINPQFRPGTLRESFAYTLKVCLRRAVVFILLVRLVLSILFRTLTWMVRARPPEVSAYQRARYRMAYWYKSFWNVSSDAEKIVFRWKVAIWPVEEVVPQNELSTRTPIERKTSIKKKHEQVPGSPPSLAMPISVCHGAINPQSSPITAPPKVHKTSKTFSVSIPGHQKIKLQLSNKLNGSTGDIKRSIAMSDTSYLAQVTSSIQEIFDAPNYDDGSLAPVIIRLAWHCCATYNKSSNSGGSNGSTMRFLPELSDEGNYGLDVARAALEPVKFMYPRITYSDLWTLAGKVAIEYIGGPQIEWKCGRVDCPTDWYVPPNGRLPFASKDAHHVRTTFERMGFNDRETVALIGCHAVGRCHKRLSGWEGKWTRTPTQFSNGFFKALVDEKWLLGSVPETGRIQYFNEDKSLMMVNTDMELINDKAFRSHVHRFAANETEFFSDFAEAFAKLLELGIARDASGNVLLRNILPLLQTSARP